MDCSELELRHFLTLTMPSLSTPFSRWQTLAGTAWKCHAEIHIEFVSVMGWHWLDAKHPQKPVTHSPLQLDREEKNYFTGLQVEIRTRRDYSCYVRSETEIMTWVLLITRQTASFIVQNLITGSSKLLDLDNWLVWVITSSLTSDKSAF